VWLWGCSSRKISSPGPVFHGTKWLLWRPHIQSRTLHSRCGINKGLIKRGSTIYHWRSRCKGWILWPTPYTYIHTYIPHPVNFWMHEPIFLKLGMHIMAPEPISTASFRNLSVCVCMCIPPIGARQRLGKHAPAATNTHVSAHMWSSSGPVFSYNSSIMYLVQIFHVNRSLLIVHNTPVHSFGLYGKFTLVFVLVSRAGMRLSLLGTSAIIWPIVPTPNDRWWMWSSRWNEN
jgi:hypothetical protein